MFLLFMVYIKVTTHLSNDSKTSLTRTRLTQTLGLHGRNFLARSKVLGFI